MTHLGYSGSQITSHDVFVPLQFGLNDDQGEVGLGVHIASHVLDLFDLGFDALVDVLEEPVGRPPIS